MRELHGAVATSVNVSVAKPPLSSPRPQPLDQLLDLAKSLVHLRQRAREPILGCSLGDGDFEVRDRDPEQLQQAARLFARHGASSPSAYAPCTPGAPASLTSRCTGVRLAPLSEGASRACASLASQVRRIERLRTRGY